MESYSTWSCETIEKLKEKMDGDQYILVNRDLGNISSIIPYVTMCKCLKKENSQFVDFNTENKC